VTYQQRCATEPSR